MVYGRNDGPEKFVMSFMHTLDSGVKELEMTEGNQKRDFVYAPDVAKAVWLLTSSLDQLETGVNHIYVGSGSLISIKSFALRAQKIFKSAINLKFGSLPYRKNEIMEPQADVTYLSSLGWSPEFTIEKGIEDMKVYIQGK